MKNLKIIFFGIIYSLLIIYNSGALENRILFKVNNEIITSLDILTELKYLETINSDFKKTKKEQAFEIAKRSLIKEKIKEIELKKVLNEIIIEDELLEDLLISYYEGTEIQSLSDFEKYFFKNDIDPNLIKKKISIEVMWNQLIFSKFNQNVKINKKLIKNDLTNNSKQKEFLLSEILLNINENENFNEKLNLLEKNINETNFSQSALTYSVSDTAKDGGKLGWIKETRMSLKVKKILQNIKVGNYTKPIVMPGGFLILKVEDIREVDNDFDLNEEIEKVIKEKTNKQLNQLSNIYFNKVKKDITINEL